MQVGGRVQYLPTHQYISIFVPSPPALSLSREKDRPPALELQLQGQGDSPYTVHGILFRKLAPASYPIKQFPADGQFECDVVSAPVSIESSVPDWSPRRPPVIFSFV